MKLYTKTGDCGETSLIGGRLFKDNLRTEAYGTSDELSSHIGLLLAFVKKIDRTDFIHQQLQEILKELFKLQTELANISKDHISDLSAHIELTSKLEVWIDSFEEAMPPLESFILPTGTLAACQSHVARSVCRRLERVLVTLYRQNSASKNQLIYTNRLSDYFFSLSRYLNFIENYSEIEI